MPLTKQYLIQLGIIANENNIENARNQLRFGAAFPYDHRTEVINDPALRAAQGVLWDLGGRRRIDIALADIDNEVRRLIVDSLSEIIRQAYESPKNQ